MCTRRLTLIARTRTAVKVNYGSEREITLTLNSCFNFSHSRAPQEAYEYAIRREKGIKHSRTMKKNPFGDQY